MAKIIIRDSSVYLLEKNGQENFYMTLEEYENSLNRTSDQYRDKIDLLGEMVADLWINSQGGL